MGKRTKRRMREKLAMDEYERTCSEAFGLLARLVGKLAVYLRKLTGMRVWEVDNGHVAWWVIARTEGHALEITVRSELRAGTTYDEIGYLVAERLKWEQARKVQISDGYETRSAEQVFKSDRGKAGMMACSEW